MMILRTYPAGFGCASLSPFCVKAMHFLNACGEDWRPDVLTDPRRAPKGKFPVLVDDDDIIPDSCAIRTHLQHKTGTDFDAGLSDRDRALAHAMARMAEEHLYFAVVRDRWLNDAHWIHVKATYFDAIPAIVRGFVTRGIRKGVVRDLDGQGLGRLTEDELCDRVAVDLNAIRGSLRGPYMMGAHASSADYSVGPMLSALAASPGQSKLKSLIVEDGVLMDYAHRVAELVAPTADAVAAAA